MKRFGLIFSMIFIILAISACVVPASQIEVEYLYFSVYLLYNFTDSIKQEGEENYEKNSFAA